MFHNHIYPEGIKAIHTVHTFIFEVVGMKLKRQKVYIEYTFADHGTHTHRHSTVQRKIS